MMAKATNATRCIALRFRFRDEQTNLDEEADNAWDDD